MVKVEKIQEAYNIEEFCKNKNVIGILGGSVAEIKEKIGFKNNNDDLDFEDYLNAEFQFLDSVVSGFESLLGIKNIDIYYSDKANAIVLGKIY